MRLRSALQGVVTIAAAMAAEWLFVRVTGALQVSVAAGMSHQAAARVGVVDHATLVIAMVLGTMIGMMSGFAGPMCTEVRSSLAMFTWIPVPLIAGLALGLEVGDHRTVTLVLLVGVFAVGTYARRFGPRGFLGGVLGFIGYFLGFFLRAHAGISLTDLGWLSAEAAVGAAVALVVQFTVFYPARRAAARLAVRSYHARAGQSVRLALALLHHDHPTRRARLDRRLARLNEAAMIADARIAQLRVSPSGWPDPEAARRHLRRHEADVLVLTCAIGKLAAEAPGPDEGGGHRPSSQGHSPTARIHSGRWVRRAKQRRAHCTS